MRTGKFDYNTLTVSFGGKLSKPSNMFTAKAIKVPNYKYKVKERESLGNGWYGGMEVNEYEEDNLYVIIKGGVCIGQMNPYAKCHNIKSALSPCNIEAKRFLAKEGILYNPDLTTSPAGE